MYRNSVRDTTEAVKVQPVEESAGRSGRAGQKVGFRYRGTVQGSPCRFPVPVPGRQDAEVQVVDLMYQLVLYLIPRGFMAFDGHGGHDGGRGALEQVFGYVAPDLFSVGLAFVGEGKVEAGNSLVVHGF